MLYQKQDSQGLGLGRNARAKKNTCGFFHGRILRMAGS